MPGGYHQAGGTFTVTGSGDIAPDAPGGAGPGRTLDHTLVGALAGLIAVVVVATMFITAEYRRGLIRTTFAASPRRGRVLAAKAIVIAAVSFAAGLAAAVIAIPLNSHVLRANGNYLYPVNLLTRVRLAAGTAAMLAVAAVLALALGADAAPQRHRGHRGHRGDHPAVPPVAVTNVLPAGADNWLMRLAPAAGFAVQQTIPNYPQVSNALPVAQGCYPLAPWAGFAVLCAWAAAALGLAVVAAAPEGRVTAALRAEWTKLRTIPGHGLAAARRRRGDRGGQRRGRGVGPVPGRRLRADPGKISLTGVDLGQAAVAIVAVLAVSTEYSTGMIRTTLAAMPGRVTVLAAKAAVVSVLILAAGALAAAGSLLAGWLILPGHGFTRAHGFAPLTLADGPVLRATAGSVLYLALIGLLSLGAAARCGTRPWPSGSCSACSTWSRSSPPW